MAGAFGVFIIVVIILYTRHVTKSERNFSKNFYSADNDLVKYEVEDIQQNDLNLLIQTLREEFPFYNNWAREKRLKFAQRTYHVRNSKSFHGMEGFEVTPRHEIIISATLARLTFGISQGYVLPKFEMIQIYPREFYSRLIGQHVKGLTIGNGRLFLSWAHFEDGHNDPQDKIHVGLHEFAHAMMIEFGNFEDLPQWKNWLKYAVPVMNEVKITDDHFFRSYGATNIYEFWAVAVESFFEQPMNFQRIHPVLYNVTCKMLNQNPIAEGH